MNTIEKIIIEKRNATGIIRLNRPEARNALDKEMLRDIGDSLAELEKDDQVRVIILAGKQDFCAGGDLKQMQGMTSGEAEIFARLGHKLMNSIEDCPKPVIAAVAGYALGGGCELALACDMRIADESAKFGQPEVAIGLIPGFGGTQRLTRLVGIARAKELILTGRTINSSEAEFIGLVNSIAPNGELLAKAEELAEQIAQKSPAAIRLSKRLINTAGQMEKAMELEIQAFAECFEAPDSSEGITAFLEKRKPKFDH
jgi:enoyl-CoA hydratase